MINYISPGTARRIAHTKGIRVPRATFYRLIDRGWIPAEKVGGRLLIFSHEFELWLKKPIGWYPKK